MQHLLTETKRIAMFVILFHARSCINHFIIVIQTVKLTNGCAMNELILASQKVL